VREREFSEVAIDWQKETGKPTVRDTGESKRERKGEKSDPEKE